MSARDMLSAWAADRQLVTTADTDGALWWSATRVNPPGRTGKVIGYVAVDGDPHQSRVQVQLTTGGVAWIAPTRLRPLGLRPAGRNG